MPYIGFMKLWMFFEFNPVFSVEDIDQFLAKHGTGNRWTRKSLIAYHVKQGHLLRLRKHRPQRPHYLFRNRRRDSGLVKGWNLLVPYEILAFLKAAAL